MLTPTCARRAATGAVADHGSYLAYWDRWAQPWERQALIKVRPVAGDMELARRFCAEAEARVHRPARPGHGGRGAPHEGPGRVRAAPAGADPKLHLKLGPGGLADVEWTAQLLRLVGGAQPAVRVQPTLDALEALAAARRILDGQAWLADMPPSLPCAPAPRLPGRGPPRGRSPPPTRSPWNALARAVRRTQPPTTLEIPPAPAARRRGRRPLGQPAVTWPEPPTSATRPTDAGSPRWGATPARGEAAHGYPQPPLLVGVGDLMVDVSVEAPALAR